MLVLFIYIYISRLAPNEIFSPWNKMYREGGRAKDLSAPLYTCHSSHIHKPLKFKWCCMHVFNTMSLHISNATSCELGLTSHVMSSHQERFFRPLSLQSKGCGFSFLGGKSVDWAGYQIRAGRSEGRVSISSWGIFFATEYRPAIGPIQWVSPAPGG